MMEEEEERMIRDIGEVHVEFLDTTDAWKLAHDSENIHVGRKSATRVTLSHTHTHKGLSIWVSASVLMNLSPGGGVRLMSHTIGSRWASEASRGQQINLHYISIPTIRLIREALWVRARPCVCVCLRERDCECGGSNR